jgi:hypothetical protein
VILAERGHLLAVPGRWLDAPDTSWLRPEQLSALGALLTGTRRGKRAQQSILLALHRNPNAAADEVPGAAHRINLLLDLQRLAGSKAPRQVRPVAVGSERDRRCPARAPAAL